MKNFAGRLKKTLIGDNLVRRAPVLYGRMMDLTERMERAGLEERKAFAKQRLQKILAVAVRTRYGGQYAGREIDQWPLLDRRLVRDDPNAFLCGPAWTGFPATTTGTSGIPLQLRRSLANVVNEQVRLDGLFARCGVRPQTARVAVLRGDDIKHPADREPPFWKEANGGRRLIFSSNHLSKDTIHHFHGALVRYTPHCLAAYPTALESLCDLLRRFNLELQVPLVVTSSEVLSTETWRLALEVLGAKVVDYYGQAERVAFAAAFQPETYRFLP